MSRLFAYCRVSTADQTTENQMKEIEAAGFAVAKQRIIAETVSGSVAASERKGFSKLLDKLDAYSGECDRRFRHRDRGFRFIVTAVSPGFPVGRDRQFRHRDR